MVLVGSLLAGSAGADPFYVEGGITKTIIRNLVYTGEASIGYTDADNHLIIQSGGSLKNSVGEIGHMIDGSNNTVVVSGAGSLWTNTSALFVGYYASYNSLTITNGGSVGNAGNGYIGRRPPASYNQVVVSGSSSDWICHSVLAVGNYSDHNRLTLSDGAYVSSFSSSIGVNSEGSNNTVVVQGQGSLWHNTYDLNIGAGGSENVLMIRDGACVENDHGIIGKGSSSCNNRVVVSGAGSVWTNADDLLIGELEAYDNGLTVTNGALVRADYVTISTNNNLTLADGQLKLNLDGYKLKIYGDLILYGTSELTGYLTLYESARLKATLSPGNEGGGCLSVSGDVVLAGTLTLLLDDELSVAVGDTFELFDCAGSMSGSFSDWVLPALDSGMMWDTSNLASNGVIRVVEAPPHYVSIDGADLSPYTNWASAAHSIQDAVDVAADHETVVVAAGTYLLDRPVSISKPIRVKSESGANLTLLDGQGQCQVFSLSGDVLVDGFTITNGYSATDGGGVQCADTTSRLMNCTITGNVAQNCGGGCYKGALTNCIISGNIVMGSSSGYEHGGGCYSGTQTHCVISDNSGAVRGGGCYSGYQTDCIISNNSSIIYGGGTYNGTQTRCTIRDNYAKYNGGGCCSGNLISCLIVGNTAGSEGGGVYSDNHALNSCTVVSNSAPRGGGVYALLTQVTDCIIGFNTADSDVNYHDYQSSEINCCIVNGTTDIASDPCFINSAQGDYHLRCNSPCIDAGSSHKDMDLDGNPRSVDGDFNGSATADIGAYEYSPERTDSDDDGMCDYAEYVADTSLTNAADYFCVQAADGCSVSFTSATGRDYTLQVCTNLVESSWRDVAALTGSGVEEVLCDPESPRLTAFYRVKVTLNSNP